MSVPTLVVADTLRAFGDIAAWARRELGAPVAAITGSNGKTTTKELLAAALGARGLVHKTEGNLNNLIGVPQTLFRWRPEAWAAVVEMGMNAPGEIARLTDIAQPTVGLVTCVAPAHLEGLGSLEAVAAAKAELFDHLAHDATAVLNADDAPLLKASNRVLGPRRVLRFGSGDGCDVRLVACTPEANGLRMQLHMDARDSGAPAAGGPAQRLERRRRRRRRLGSRVVGRRNLPGPASGAGAGGAPAGAAGRGHRRQHHR